MQTVSRLIQNFIPVHYDLSLTIERVNRTFSGVVTLTGSALQDDTITVHAKDLQIETVTIDGHTASFSQGDDDELTLTRAELVRGEHIVVIGFSGTITDQMHGLYPCYFDHDGVTKELLATQFESHHAREVFPCIDEPEAKATFDVTLSTETNITVLGNMPVKRQREENDMLVTQFETSPRMSSYLLAFVCGEMHKKTATTIRGVEVNVWATMAQPPESLDFALDFAVKTTDYYEEYFGVEYPLPKCDHVALPDFTSGAMENWGLITYREIALLADPATATVDSKHYVAMVVGHELSHQWFGNLVTMKWWDNLWLNESFANFIENIPIHSMHPDWEIWMDYASTWSLMALRRDAIEGVQPVQTTVNHPDEIGSLFDGAIVYGKGGRLIGMLRQYVGEDDFKAGLQQYFKKFQYQNTSGDDLWDCLEAVSKKPVREFMNKWVLRPGYPVVHVGEQYLEQEQFFIGEHEPSDVLWPIPLAATDNAVPSVLEDKRIEVAIDKSTRLNIGNWSHFITHYSDDHFEHLLNTIQTTDPLDRLQLLNERVLLTRSGHVSNSSLIPMLKQSGDESNESVWGILNLALSELRKFVEFDDEHRAHLKRLALLLSDTQFARLGWDGRDGESENDTKLRPSMIALQLYGENESVVRESRRRYQDAGEVESLDPELRGVILAGHVKAGIDDTQFNKLLAMHKSSASATVQEDIIGALTGSEDTEQLKKLLSLITDKSVVRPQDASHWYIYLVRNRLSKTLAWDWLRNNWDWVEATYGGDKSYDDFARYTAGALSTQQQLDEYVAFFTPLKREPGLVRVIELGISEITARVALVESQKQDVLATLAKL